MPRRKRTASAGVRLPSWPRPESHSSSHVMPGTIGMGDSAQINVPHSLFQRLYPRPPRGQATPMSKQRWVLVPSIFGPWILAVHCSIGPAVSYACCLIPCFRGA